MRTQLKNKFVNDGGWAEICFRFPGLIIAQTVFEWFTKLLPKPVFQFVAESYWRQGREFGFGRSSKKLRGCTLPKQDVNFIGKRSMLEHTFSRAQKIIPAERLFTVVSQSHPRYPEVTRQLSSRPTA